MTTIDSTTPVHQAVAEFTAARLLASQPPVPGSWPPPVGTPTPVPGHPADQLHAGQQLVRGDALNSPNGRVRLVLQEDGNLVLYRNDNGVVLWSSRTSGQQVVRAVMQGDGNFVCYDTFNRAYWATGTNGRGGRRVVMQDDGNLVVYTAGGAPVWASNTWHDWSPVKTNTDNQHLDTGEWMSSAASVSSTGLISGHTRIWTTNETRGFHGSVFPVLYDAGGFVIWPGNIDAQKHQYGVDGTWIPGLPSDRTCYWSNQVDPALLAQSHGIGLVQFKDPKNMLLRDLDILKKAYDDIEPIIKAIASA